MSIHRYNNFSMFSLLYLCLGLMCFCHTCRQTTTPSLSLTLSQIVGCWDVYENYFTLSLGTRCWEPTLPFLFPSILHIVVHWNVWGNYFSIFLDMTNGHQRYIRRKLRLSPHSCICFAVLL